MRKISLFFAVAFISVFALGCANDSSSNVPTSTDGGNAQQDDHDHDHAHEPGPNGGQIIELGHDHEFHAEIVHDDDAGTVTIYMLDGDMKPNSIDEATVSLTLTAGDSTKSYELASGGQGNSQFVSSEAELISMLDAEGTEGKLRATIGGTPYTGAISHHDHDH